MLHVLLSKPAAFLLGAATLAVVEATAPALKKVTEPVVTGTIKQGIKVSRSVQGSASRLSASFADSYAKARHELEREEREGRNSKSGPKVVNIEDHQGQSGDKPDGK